MVSPKIRQWLLATRETTLQSVWANLPSSRLLARNNFQTFRIHAIEEITRLAIINGGCLGLMAMGWRKEGLNRFLQVASAELPILDRAYEPLSVGVGIGR